MYILCANGKILDTYQTKKECQEDKKDYKEIEYAMFGKNRITFKIKEIK